jgi:4-hydroxybenzoate polyprenyltransferase
MPELVTRRADQMLSFQSMVTAAVTLIVGVLIFNEVQAALPDTTGGVNSTPVTSTIESAFQLAPVVLIVLVAALILAQVAGFNTRRE